jgi:Protein kinase domain
MADLSGHELGGCRLIRPIGLGGMGEVYLGEQIRLGNRLVAVKVVRLDDAALPPETIAEIERRFTREAALLGSFSHPNILPVHDAGVQDGMLYLVMEYVPDGSLADAIRPGPAQKLKPPLPPDLVADLISQVAAALQYTHEHGVVHRDVKPGNILARRTPEGKWQLLLADYGIARGIPDTGQKTQVTGTLTYMAPEQFSGQFSPASDQYALAVVTYQLLAGRPPFEGDLATLTQGQLYEAPPSIRTFNPAISPALEAVVLRALSKKPAGRYPSVFAFAAALRSAAAQPAAAPVPAPSEPAPPAPPARWPLPGERPTGTAGQGERKRRPGLARAWIAVVAAIVLLVGAIGSADLLSQRGQTTNPPATQTTQPTGGAVTRVPGTGVAVSPGTGGPQATQTAVAYSATATAAAYIPTATATASFNTDMTSPPPAPAQANSIVFADAAPRCHGDNPYTPPWVVDNNTKVNCPAAGGTELTAQSSGALACIEQHNVPSDAYISVLVTTPQGGAESNDAVLAFRQANVPVGTPTPGTTSYASTGYFFALVRASSEYSLYQYDSATHQTALASGTLPTGPAADFALGVLVQGSQITLYVNGQPIGGPITDTRHATGWMALCTNGDTIFKDVQVYSLKPA